MISLLTRGLYHHVVLVVVLLEPVGVEIVERGSELGSQVLEVGVLDRGVDESIVLKESRLLPVVEILRPDVVFHLLHLLRRSVSHLGSYRSI